MFQLIQVFQRSVLLPLTFLTIITDWVNVLQRASTAGTKVVDREINNWEEQINTDSAELESMAADLKAAQQALAKSKATSKVKTITDASKFTS